MLLTIFSARWRVRTLGALLCGCMAALGANTAFAQRASEAAAEFEAFERKLPPDHGLALGWGRGHVLSLATALTQPGSGLGIRDRLKLSDEQSRALKEAVALQAKETVKAPKSPDPTDGDPEGEAFASLETLDAAGRAAFAAAKLSDEQKSLVFRTLIALQGAEALRNRELAPASLQLDPTRQAALTKHVREQFFHVAPSPTEPKRVRIEDASPEKRQEMRRNAQRALDRAIWSQLTAEQRDELAKLADDLPKLDIPVEPSAVEPARDTGPKPDPASPGDPIPAPETPAPAK